MKKFIAVFLSSVVLALFTFGCCHNLEGLKNLQVVNSVNPADYLKSVAELKVRQVEDPTSGVLATGFAVDKDHILTSAHFCIPAIEASVMGILEESVDVIFLNNNDQLVRYIDGEIVAVDEPTDLCLIKRKKHGLVPMKIFDSYEDLRVGERVFTIGSPGDFFPTITEGRVVSLHSMISIPFLRGSLVTSIVAFHGNSGGPIFNSDGEVVGIMKAMFTPHRHITFGSTADEILKFLEENE
jgi:S1-C subfamily serine protease